MYFITLSIPSGHAPQACQREQVFNIKFVREVENYKQAKYS